MSGRETSTITVDASEKEKWGRAKNPEESWTEYINRLWEGYFYG